MVTITAQPNPDNAALLNAVFVRSYPDGTEVFCETNTGTGTFGHTNTLYHRITKNGDVKITRWSGFYDDGAKLYHFLFPPK